MATDEFKGSPIEGFFKTDRGMRNEGKITHSAFYFITDARPEPLLVENFLFRDNPRNIVVSLTGLHQRRCSAALGMHPAKTTFS